MIPRPPGKRSRRRTGKGLSTSSMRKQIKAAASQGKARRGPTFREVLLMHAVGRITYRDLIPNVQVSWVKCGIGGARQVLQAGANDLGGTLMDENISRAAGASHGQELDEAEFRAIVEPLGRRLAQRTTLYGRVTTQGRRLRPVEEVPVTLGSRA